MSAGVHLLLKAAGVAGLVLLHAGALWALIRFDWRWLAASLILWQVTCVLGISLGYHRLLNHGAFSCGPVFKSFLLFMGCLAGQLGPMRWVRVHRAHHRHADSDTDPHSPRNGFWHSHFGWLLETERRAALPELHAWPRDLLRDPIVLFFERAYPFILLASIGLYAYWGGLDGFLWLGAFRICLALHSIWSINSVGHRFGRRDFPTPDDSRNHRLLAWITGGESLHNNHHAHPGSARLSVRTGEMDPGWLILKGFAKVGLVWDMKTVAWADADP